MDHDYREEETLTDDRIVARLREGAETEAAFTANCDARLERMQQSVASRGDLFDSDGAVAFDLDGEEVIRVPMPDLPVTIGSGEKADVRLAYKGISRVHCRLEAVGGLVRLCDENSRNGTRLNGRLIHREELCDGDQVRLGTATLSVRRA